MDDRQDQRPSGPRVIRAANHLPSRRIVLKTLFVAAVGAPVLYRLGAVLQRKPRLVRPQDLSPIPWIGHC